jgi:hypothetical protein
VDRRLLDFKDQRVAQWQKIGEIRVLPLKKVRNDAQKA